MDKIFNGNNSDKFWSSYIISNSNKNAIVISWFCAHQSLDLSKLI